MKNLGFLILLSTICLTGYTQMIFVDINNTSGIEDGTEQHPFNTIAEGIIASVPGTTIMIKQGIYIPDSSWSGSAALILKAGVKLVGEGKTQTIIDGIVVDKAISNLPITVLFHGNFLSEKMEFDVGHLQPGIYFCKITLQDAIVFKKILKI